ncbi:MAG: prolipoprotein diacylglyceryl transferase [Betaproteobacteria bacterium]|jgi:phosphatidylglycerol:prolipoprotein diacylglycerol transferase|nr:prolipoprotein diacylglyceryl transferase [Betaproteobacteria bacterium]
MFVHPEFDPVALQLGPLTLRWYGLMYLLGFALIWLAGRYRIGRASDGVWTRADLDDALFYGILGTIIGGRLGYVLFYKFGEYVSAPWKVFYVWEGGMSFHGGFLGVVIAMVWFARTRRQDWLRITDFIAPLVPLGLGAGRIGNFINAELWGRPTDLPWAMVFPNVDRVARHPSQLYEFALEGVVLFVLLWWFSMKPRPRGAVSALFLIGYGVFRFGVEYTREPDSFLGELALGMTMGQWLSLPMVAGGAALLAWSLRGARRR